MSRTAYRREVLRRLLCLPRETDMRLFIASLPAERREYLRGLVDWIEDYEREERAESA